MESEIKIEVADLAPVRERLQAIGALREGEVQEHNVYFDRDGELRGRHQSLRLRQDARARLTWKGPSSFDAGVLSRAEVEIEVSDIADTRTILRQLGFEPVEELAKHRETWRVDDVEVALDTLSFGRFVELEGDAARVPALARRLGLNPEDGVPHSYRILREQRQPPKGTADGEDGPRADPRNPGL